MKRNKGSNSFFENIFSIKDHYIRRVITILGIKFKFRSKRLLKKYGVKRNSFFEDVFSVKNDGVEKVVTVLGAKIKFRSGKLCKDVLESSPITLSTLLVHYCSEVGAFDSENTKSVTILIPLYNGLERFKKLISSLIKNTSPKVNVIIIDDCSSDFEVQVYLKKLKRITNYTIIRNNRNLGFVKTVNKGMSLIKTEYAVWLNSDTIVPERWLERLLFPFNNSTKIATATPFSNSAAGFSFPLFFHDNEMKVTLSEIDSLFQHVECNDITLNYTYSGTGFCMAIDMRAWKEIGYLDEVNFGEGYGEENDWCFRANKKGWKHLLVPNLFVYHDHGKSFGDRKQRLVEEHLGILRLKYPKEMNEVVPEFMNTDPWKVYRQLVSILYGRNCIMLIDLNPKSLVHSGAVVYRNNLLNELEDQGYTVFILQYEMNKANMWSLVPYSCSPDLEINLSTFMEIKFLFDIRSIQKVIVNNFAFLLDVEETIFMLTKLKQRYDFHLSYKFHDYLSVCPSFFLLDDRFEDCTSYVNKKHCDKCLRQNEHLVVHRESITCWRESWKCLLKNVDQFDFFSNYSLEKVKKIYPFVEKKAIVKEHKVEFPRGRSVYIKPKSTEKLTFAFVGNFCKEKGSEYFLEFMRLLQTKNVNARGVILGINNYGKLPENITYLSQYTKRNMGELLTKNEVHVVIYPSVNNETFSYVAQELMLLKVPLIVFNNGAHAERVKKYNYKLGRVSDTISAQGLYRETRLLMKQIYFVSV